MKLCIVSISCVAAIATLTACSVTHTHEAAQPARATYELWINGKPVQKKTVTWEYPDPMEEPDE